MNLTWITFIALGPDPKMLRVRIDVVDVQHGQLPETDAGAQQHVNHHPVAQRGEFDMAFERLEPALFFRDPHLHTA